jgi:C-terminal processing protease CtpA/Prc
VRRLCKLSPSHFDVRSDFTCIYRRTDQFTDFKSVRATFHQAAILSPANTMSPYTSNFCQKGVTIRLLVSCPEFAREFGTSDAYTPVTRPNGGRSPDGYIGVGDMTRKIFMMAVTAIAALTAYPLAAQQSEGSEEAPPASGTTQSDQENDGSKNWNTNQGADAADRQSEQRTNSDRNAPNSSADNDSQSQSRTQSKSPSRDQSSGNQTRRSYKPNNRSTDRNRSEQSYLDSGAREGQGRNTDYRHGVEFGRASERGLTITNVERNSIYYDSGIRQNDVIISVDGRPIRNDRDFYGFARPGARVPVLILRDGRQETVYITYDQNRGQVNREFNSYDQSSGSQAYLGVRFEGRVRDGAIVSSVIPGSPADEAGLQRGDEIVAINGREVQSAQEVTRLVAAMQPGDTVDIDFSRRIDERTQAVLQGREGSSTASTGEYRQEVYRGGPQYDQVEGRQFDQTYPNDSRQGFENSDSRRDDSSGRRDTRPLLPRLRN